MAKVQASQHTALVAKGLNSDLATKALSSGINWQAMLALIVKYGLPMAEEIIAILLAGKA